MSKFLMVCFYIASYSLVCAAVEVERLTPMAKHLYHVLTQRGKMLEAVERNHRFLFTNGHWIKGLSHEPTDTKNHTSITNAQNVLLLPNTETGKFHTILALKLIEGYKQGKILGNYDEKRRLHRPGKLPLSVYKKTPDAFKFEQEVRPNFLDGHCLTATIKTRCPKVLVSLYEEKDSPLRSDDRPESFSKWFMPVEQTFFAQI